MKHHVLKTGLAPLAVSVLLGTAANAADFPTPHFQDLHQIPKAETLREILLVHGAFVDASVWWDVAQELQGAGYVVRAAQLPLTSLEADAKAVDQVLDRMNGPVLMVGYSWGGMPVTQTGDDAKVKGLVYVAAMAPEKGQSINDLFDRNAPGLPGQEAVEISEDGFFWLQTEGFHMALMHDANKADADLRAAMQKPTAVVTFGEPVSVAAWENKPSWYAISADDQIVPADLQRQMAANIDAVTIELNTGHASIVSQPKLVASFIGHAAMALSGELAAAAAN